MMTNMADGSKNGENEETSENGDINHDMHSNNGHINIETMVQAYAQEYEHLDHTLDELDSWMNKLEEQNDNLSAELDALLESSRLVRRELQQEVSITAATEELQLDSGIASLNKGDFTLVGNMFEGTQDCDTWSSEVHNVQSVNESDTSVVQNVQSVHESDISGQDGSQTYSNDETYGVCTQANQDNS